MDIKANEVCRAMTNKTASCLDYGQKLVMSPRGAHHQDGLTNQLTNHQLQSNCDSGACSSIKEHT